MLGSKLVIPSTATLVSFGVIAISGGPQVKMALYTDVGGDPGTLVAETPATLVTPGVMEIDAVTTVTLTAGTYWIMGVYDQTASIGYSTQDSTAEVAFISHSFAAPLPQTFPMPERYAGQLFNYYLVVY